MCLICRWLTQSVAVDNVGLAVYDAIVCGKRHITFIPTRICTVDRPFFQLIRRKPAEKSVFKTVRNASLKGKVQREKSELQNAS